MRITDESTIPAPVEHVWAVYSDVERWPTWTSTVRTLELVHGDHVEVGARVRIDQPRLPVLLWEVTEVEPGRSWTWMARRPGARTTARHVLTPCADGSTRVRQEIEQTGLLGRPVGRLLAKLTREYLATEAKGLAQACLARPGEAGDREHEDEGAGARPA